PHVEIPQIMERPMRLLVPIGRMTTTWARLPEVVATVGDDLGLWQVCGCGDPGAWVGSVLTWTEHRGALLAQRFGPELYDKRLRGATRCSRYSLTISRFTEDADTWLQEAWSIVLEFDEPPSVQGNPSLARARFLVEQAPVDRLKPGHAFELYEEKKKVAMAG